MTKTPPKTISQPYIKYYKYDCSFFYEALFWIQEKLILEIK